MHFGASQHSCCKISHRHNHACILLRPLTTLSNVLLVLVVLGSQVLPLLLQAILPAKQVLLPVRRVSAWSIHLQCPVQQLLCCTCARHNFSYKLSTFLGHSSYVELQQVACGLEPLD